MLNIIKINSTSSQLNLINKLYEDAFPENERGPFNLLIEDNSSYSEILAFYDNNKFCGFTSSLIYKDIYHIIYFAVEPSLQGKSYGSQILSLLSDIKENYRIIVDIEVESPTATNNLLRAKRKSFYLKNNFISTEVNYNWQGDPYEILTNRGTLTKNEFWDFWDKLCGINPNFQHF